MERMPSENLSAKEQDKHESWLQLENVGPNKSVGYLPLETIDSYIGKNVDNVIEYLRNKGLAQGASLENAIGIDQDTIMNTGGLRYEDECVRHKLLDSIGDFYTAGHIRGAFTCHKTGHYTNNQLLRKLLEDPNAYQWCA